MLGDDECWPWLGYVAPHGYGTVNHNGRKVAAHTLAWQFGGGFEGGSTPETPIHHVCHPSDGACDKGRACQHRRCCNPTHLQRVSRRQNILEGTSMSAIHARKTECVNGHPYTVENTRVDEHGWRDCRHCARDKEWRRRHPEGI